jgi:hypothetical protein
MTRTFSADVGKIMDGYLEGLRDVARQSIQEVVREAQTPRAKGGRMPVDTGNLRNSLASGLNGAFGAPGSDSYTLIIAALRIGDVARFAWTAEYARRIELGFSGADSLGRVYEQSGAGFVSAAAANWQNIVSRNAIRVRSRRR